MNEKERKKEKERGSKELIDRGKEWRDGLKGKEKWKIKKNVFSSSIFQQNNADMYAWKSCLIGFYLFVCVKL